MRLRRAAASLSLAVLVSLALLGAMVPLIYGVSRHGFYNDAGAEYVTAKRPKQTHLQSRDTVATIGFNSDVRWSDPARMNLVAENPAGDTCLFRANPQRLKPSSCRSVPHRPGKLTQP